MTTHAPPLVASMARGPAASSAGASWWPRVRRAIARWFARRQAAAPDRAARRVPVGGWYEHDAFLSSRRAVRRPGADAASASARWDGHRLRILGDLR